VVRYVPKGFRQRRPDGKGGWIWSLGDVRSVPYRLPDLMEAVAQARPILIVEGEKDVESLRQLNVSATTNAGGAGKWRPEYAEYFRDADVMLCRDNDEAGREHMEIVAASLTVLVARLRTLNLPNLPDKGDVSDWIAAGGTAAELWKLSEAAPGWVPLTEKANSAWWCAE
jgi:DNA primase